MTSPPTPFEPRPNDLPPAGYETRDVNIRVVLWLGASVAVVIVLAGGGVRLLLEHYRAEAKRNDPPVSPLADTAQIPPSPRLQRAPNREYREFHAAQEAKLHSYGWIDRPQGVLRIPISRAMDLLAERGLPTPAGPELPASETEK